MLAGKRVLVGGSTHEGEETVLLSVYHRLRVQHPDLFLVLAPRHLERVATVARHIQAYGYRAVRRSQYEAMDAAALAGPSVIILDTLGELARLYDLCTVAFVGGSLVPICGHNIL
jgi:3-deoxy-D-manno-octulosonic-acid transferase